MSDPSPEPFKCEARIKRSDYGDPYDWDCDGCNIWSGDSQVLLDIIQEAEDAWRGMINDDEIRELLPCPRTRSESHV